MGSLTHTGVHCHKRWNIGSVSCFSILKWVDGMTAGPRKVQIFLTTKKVILPATIFEIDLKYSLLTSKKIVRFQLRLLANSTYKVIQTSILVIFIYFIRRSWAPFYEVDTQFNFILRKFLVPALYLVGFYQLGLPGP